MTTLFKDGKPGTPTGLKVAPQSYASLEKVATQLVGLLPKQARNPYRLDCIATLENTLHKAGFNLRVEADYELATCAAFTIPDCGIIVFRESIYDLLHKDHVFGRSTVIHEMAHIVLKHSVTLHRGAANGPHRHFEDSEWQAKALTAATMMPLNACKLARSPENLAEMCGTSIEAATYRLERLRNDGASNAMIARRYA